MKILFGITLAAALAFSLAPLPAFAAQGDSCATDAACGGPPFICSGGICVDADDLPGTGFRLATTEQAPDTGSDLLARIQLVSNWVFAIFLAISLIYIILAAFQFVTAGADPQKISQAREKLVFAVIGIAIGLLVAGIPLIIRSIVI